MAKAIFGILTLAIAAVTILSLLPSHLWWVRLWDFPRLLVIAAALVLLAAAIFLLDGTARVAFALVLLAAVAIQVWRVQPWSPFAAQEVALVPANTIEPDHCFTALGLNVLQTNRDYARTIALIEREDPDILLLLETDEKWEAALEPVLARYPRRESAPLDNLYGLIFATRLPVESAHVRMLVEEGIPSVFAILQTPGGTRFRYIGLHPRPPQPMRDTEERDAEIAIAARLAAKEKLPVLAMGDFNDVSWSRTTQMFRRIGGYLDPRIGRGPHGTFPAKLPALRWPLDHVLFTPEFAFRELAVLEDVGSDHLPVKAQLCLKPRLGEAANAAPEPAREEDHQAANEAVEDLKEKRVSGE